MGFPNDDTKFKPGQSGNPNGRPKKIPELNELLAEVLGEEKDGKTAAQAILAALRAKATKGDVRAAEVLLNRAYGKPLESHKVDLHSNIETIQIIKLPDNGRCDSTDKSA